MKSSVPSTLRIMNKSMVLNIIKQDEPISRAQIAKKSSLTRATISEIVNELLAEDLVYEDGIDDGPLGRKGVLLRYNAAYRYVVGLDLGGTKISMGIIDFSGELLYQKTIPTFRVPDNQSFIQLLVKEISAFIAENQLDSKKLNAIGIASPGIIDYKNGIVVEGSPNLPGWEQLPLSKLMEEAFGVPVIIENDVRAALIGEVWKGKCQNVQSAVLLALGTGIGSALLMDGTIIRGSKNGAGEIGYMLFNREQLHHDWENKGCFETLASGSGLAKQYAMQSGANPDQISTKEIFAAAREGDALATNIVQQMIEYVSIAIINLITVINPEKVILTGGLSYSSDLFLEKVNHYVQKHTLNLNRVEIAVTDLYEAAAIYGISILALSYVQPTINFVDIKIL